MRRFESPPLSAALLSGLLSMLALALTLAAAPSSAQEPAQRRPPTAAIPADAALRAQLLAVRQALEAERARALSESQQRQNLQKLLADLRARIAAQDRRIAELEQRNGELRETLIRDRSAQAKALDEARQDVAVAQGEIRQMQGELSQSREAGAALTTDRDSWRRRAHEAEQRLGKLSTALDEKDAAMAQLIHDRWWWVAGAAALALAAGVAGTRWLAAKATPQPVSFSVSPGPWSLSCTGLGTDGATPVRLQTAWLPLRAEVHAAGPLIAPPAT